MYIVIRQTKVGLISNEYNGTFNVMYSLMPIILEYPVFICFVKMTVANIEWMIRLVRLFITFIASTLQPWVELNGLFGCYLLLESCLLIFTLDRHVDSSRLLCQCWSSYHVVTM